MGITLSKMALDAARVTLHYVGDTATIDYYPGRVTEKTYAQLKSFLSMSVDTIDISFSDFNNLLVHLIKKWDVFEDDDETIMFPLDADRLPELPIPFRMAVLGAILQDARPEALAPTMTN